MNLLLIAYECSPYRGSEWAVGWGRLLQAARVADVHCIVSETNFADLERARMEGLVPANAHIHTPAPDAELRRLEQQPVHFDYNYTAYHHWHTLAFALAQQLHREVGFHVAHQSTVCTVREPGLLHQLGIPFVWGPFGGTQNFPTRMLGVLPLSEAAKELARTLLNKVILRTSPSIRTAAHRASVILGANTTTVRDMQRIVPGSKVQRLLETGLNEVPEPDRTRFLQRVEDEEQRRHPRPLRILWSGQLRPRKALPILLRALAVLPAEVHFELDILGDGPMLKQWKHEADAIPSANPVRFLGRLPFQRAVQAMQTADLFCFTSLRDTSGNVVLEALAAGVPVVCFDHQGAHDMVDETCGIRIPVTTPGRAIADWSAAIHKLATDQHRLLALSQGATERARQFLWSVNGDHVNSIYFQLAARAADTP
ncbi:glycosyltransferase family 4 protein [Terriglobus aquaticus]|uniref:Glycosyltransferase family 4 protein n=1 Tax=Terriglobus aquaticus TaxID=940139 RepID=A0ABW9KJC5_9BACT|nr:glycosyltransferase [Terriglobus aquaticus]